MRPLYWYEYAWMALPIVLAFSGGALSAFAVLGAAHLNSRILRSDRALWLRYGLTGFVSLAAVVAFFIVAALAGSLLGGLRKSS